MSAANNAVPVAMVGGILWIAHRFYVNSRSGPGIGIGAGGGLFGVSIMSFLFGSPGEGDDSGAGSRDSGATEQKGPLEEDEGGDGGTEQEPSKGGSGENTNGSDSENENDGGEGKNAGQGGGGVGGGSGGGVGSDHGQGTDGGVGDEGGDKGVDEGGGTDDGIYDYDPYEGQYITEDLPPPDMSDAMLNAIQGTIENLVSFSVTDPGADPKVAERIPEELWTFDHEISGLLRYWADVTLHFHYDLPWGVLDKSNPTHIPYIQLWNDILSNLAKLEWSTNKNSTPITPVSSARSKGVRRRGVGDSDPNFTWFETREVFLNPLLHMRGMK